MIDKLQRFFAISVPGFPTGWLVGFAGVFVIGTILFLAFLGPRRGARWAAGLLLAEYMALILMLTVFCRKLLDVREFHLIPFRCYWYVWEGGRFLVQVCMNVLAFVPIGLLLGCAFGRMEWGKVLAVGGGFSLLIEVLQFALKRGFAEFDDVFHNVLGCAIGFGVYALVSWMVMRIRGKSDDLYEANVDQSGNDTLADNYRINN